MTLYYFLLGFDAKALLLTIDGDFLEGLSSVLSCDSGIYCFARAVSLSYNKKGSRCLSHQPFSVYHNYTGGERQSIQR